MRETKVRLSERDQGTILFRYNSEPYGEPVGQPTDIQRVQARLAKSDSPVRKEDHDIGSLCISDLLPCVCIEPCQRPTQRTPTTTTNKQPFLLHKELDCSIGLNIGCLDPVVNSLGSTRQDVRNEIVSNTFNNIRNTIICCVIQRIGVGENAAFLS